jgi:thymidylate synthase ThyX
MTMGLLCKKCDVFVGFGAVGVARQPAFKKQEWLENHCWICGRSREEIKRDPRGLEQPRDSTPIDRYIRSYEGTEPRDGLTRDVAFNRKSFGEGQPENPDQGDIHVGTDDIVVTLEQDFDDEALQHFFSFAINATRGIDPRNPPEPVDWEEMMKGGLQTALKRINISFAVYGASRTLTHQLVRSTRANFHQQSQRAHYYGDRPSVRMPESFVTKPMAITEEEYWTSNIGVAPPPHLSGGAAITSIADEYRVLAEHAAWFYRLACKDGDISYQDARFGLLEGTTNFILCEYSLDEFIAVYSYRACSMFQWEISHTMRLMRDAIVEKHPWLAPYIKISCERTHGAKDVLAEGTKARSIIEDHDGPEAFAHTCTYQGWEEVEGQCDFPWARESNRSFRSEHHRIAKAKT